MKVTWRTQYVIIVTTGLILKYTNIYICNVNTTENTNCENSHVKASHMRVAKYVSSCNNKQTKNSQISISTILVMNLIWHTRQFIFGPHELHEIGEDVFTLNIEGKQSTWWSERLMMIARIDARQSIKYDFDIMQSKLYTQDC